MEEDKIRGLFSEFEPELSSDAQFIKKLQHNLSSVETVRQHVAIQRAKNRKAVVIAAFIGFIVGFLFSLSLPYLGEAIANWRLTLPEDSVLCLVAGNFTVIAWLMIGCTSVVAALNTYEVSLSLLKSKTKRDK